MSHTAWQYLVLFRLHITLNCYGITIYAFLSIYSYTQRYVAQLCTKSFFFFFQKRVFYYTVNESYMYCTEPSEREQCSHLAICFFKFLANIFKFITEFFQCISFVIIQRWKIVMQLTIIQIQLETSLIIFMLSTSVICYVYVIYNSFSFNNQTYF